MSEGEQHQTQLIAVSRDEATGLQHLESRRLLLADEYAGYMEAIHHLHEFREAQAAIEATTEAWHQFVSASEQILASPTTLSEDKVACESAKNRLNALLAAALSASRAFVDQTQTRVVRRWGHEAAVVSAFESVTKSEFDGNVAYRVFYKLRNFVQHCGMPIRMVAVDGWVENPPDGPRRQTVRIDCSVADLLARYSEWGKAKGDLEAFGKEVPLLQLAAQMIDSLARIFHRVLEAETPRYFESGQRIVRILAEVEAPASGVVAEVGEYRDGAQNIALVEAPMDVLEIMGMVK